MVMCIFLFLLWLILNGKVTLEICLFGVVITGAVYAFCVAALGCRPQTERRFLKRLGGYVVYGAILVREIIRANLAVMRVIWSRKPDYHPAIVRVHAPLEKPVSTAITWCWKFLQLRCWLCWYRCCKALAPAWPPGATSACRKPKAKIKR